MAYFQVFFQNTLAWFLFDDKYALDQLSKFFFLILCNFGGLPAEKLLTGQNSPKNSLNLIFQT